MGRPGLLSLCFHFEQYCQQIKTYQETHLDRLYYPGCLENPPPRDGNRLSSQQKKKKKKGSSEGFYWFVVTVSKL